MTTLIAIKQVIPAKAGIQKRTGFRVKPGMTNYIGSSLWASFDI
jgi:hypothetical protein